MEAMLQIFFLFLLLPVAFSRPVQILHTNDLHSFFTGTRAGLGGYARLKTKILELRANAKTDNTPTIHLDGGDFGEGSSFFVSDKGADSLRALDLLGVDVTVLGNHDFMLGGHELARQIRRSGLKAKILSANLKNKSLLGLGKLMPDRHDLMIHGQKIRIVGLTTPDYHYQYPILPLGFIVSSHKVAMEEARKKITDKVDVLIALTHIGLEKDKRIAKSSRAYDLIIGGHDHIRLPDPVLERNLDGREIPIFQAGAHSIALGEIILDIEKGRAPKLLSYKLHEISDLVPEEENFRQFVSDAEVKREKYFGRNWDEVIGESEFPFNGYVNGIEQNQKSCWSKHLAKLTRKIASTDFAFHFDNFQGEQIPAGEITYGDLVDNFPHFRKWGDRGWQMVRIHLPGFLLRLALILQNSKDLVLTVAGPVNRIQDHVLYSVALPSEITSASLKAIPILSHLIFLNAKKVPGAFYWPVLEKYIKENSPLKCE